ncbi:MAG: hypothetical protein WKG07_07535 [Hymenobacter sp.]
MRFPGTDGSFEVLNNHAPLISALKAGDVTVTGAGGGTFHISGGIVEVAAQPSDGTGRIGFGIIRTSQLVARSGPPFSAGATSALAGKRWAAPVLCISPSAAFFRSADTHSVFARSSLYVFRYRHQYLYPRQRYLAAHYHARWCWACWPFIGVLQYLTAFLGAGILYVVLRPWFTALVHRRHWNRTFVTVLLLLFAVVVLIIPFFALTSLLIDRVRGLFAQNTDQILATVQDIQRKLGCR